MGKRGLWFFLIMSLILIGFSVSLFFLIGLQHSVKLDYAIMGMCLAFGGIIGLWTSYSLWNLRTSDTAINTDSPVPPPSPDYNVLLPPEYSDSNPMYETGGEPYFQQQYSPPQYPYNQSDVGYDQFSQQE